MMELAGVVNLIFQILNLLILLRIILSWVPGLGLDHPAVRIVHQVTSPILDPIRRVMPPVGGMDLSPIVAILVLSLARSVLLSMLQGL
jgi:YggT family protein